MDVLSDVLRVVRLTGAVFFTAEFSSPWAVDSPTPGSFHDSFAIPDAESMALFHVLVDGECWVDTPGHPTVHLGSGDVLVFPHAHQHTMRSASGVRPASLREVLPSGSRDELEQVQYGGGGKASRFICGYLACDQRFAPLVGALPTMLLVHSRDDYAEVEAVTPKGRQPSNVHRMAGPWLSTTLRYAINEAASERPGNTAMLGRLTELMFVEILRQYMHQLPSGPATGPAGPRTGWLAGLQDAHVGKALQMMHAEPARRWTVEQLAREAATSRSALAQRFTEMLGQAPMHYLAGWRIHLARQLLREGVHSIPEIAEQVGYESEAAFNRAFKRFVGKPPAAWSRAARSSPQPKHKPHPKPSARRRAAG